MKRLLILFLFILLISPLANATDSMDCAKRANISCNNCVAINVDILQNGKMAEYYTVGNYFFYNLSLTGISENISNFSINVSVETPEKNQLNRARIYTIENLKENESRFMAPNQSKNLFDIYEFSIDGAYQIKIESNEGIRFYRFYDDCAFAGGSNAFTYYFDVMPQWQYTSWKKTEELNSKTLGIYNKMIESDDKVIDLTKAIVDLTLVLVFLTVLSVGWETRDIIIENIRKIIMGYSILLIYLAKASITDYTTIILIIAALAVNFKELKKIEGHALFVFYVVSALLSWIFYEIAQSAYSHARYVDVLIYSGFLAFSFIVFIGSLRLLKKNPIHVS